MLRNKILSISTLLFSCAVNALPADHVYVATWTDDNLPGTSYRLYSIDAAGNRTLIADTPDKSYTLGVLSQPLTLIVEPYNACCVGVDSAPAVIPSGVRAVVIMR